ncbi:hypothetical protein [Streptomyces niger]|uniref:hypothetical protein n=1 Tax=Streptomyces niger TaxID=66373 RepID=UPI00069A0769|nr:hypothetical protein [Streptomyces niger]
MVAATDPLAYQPYGVAYAEVTDLSPCHAALARRAGGRDRPVVAALRCAVRTVRGRPSDT